MLSNYPNSSPSLDEIHQCMVEPTYTAMQTWQDFVSRSLSPRYFTRPPPVKLRVKVSSKKPLFPFQPSAYQPQLPKWVPMPSFPLTGGLLAAHPSSSEINTSHISSIALQTEIQSEASFAATPRHTEEGRLILSPVLSPKEIAENISQDALSRRALYAETEQNMEGFFKQVQFHDERRKAQLFARQREIQATTTVMTRTRPVVQHPLRTGAVEPRRMTEEQFKSLRANLLQRSKQHEIPMRIDGRRSSNDAFRIQTTS